MAGSRFGSVSFGVGVCLAGLVLGACSGSEGPDSGGGRVDGMSPLEEFLGQGGSPGWKFGVNRSVPRSEEELQAEVDRGVWLSELVAECMREEGFEYTPVSVSRFDRLFERERRLEEAYSLDVEEFVERYGYGIYAMGFGAAEVSEEESLSPNGRIRESLSPEAQKEYDRALTGGTGGGCDGQARAELGRDLDSEGVEEEFLQFGGLESDITGLRRRISADPRLEEAWGRWSDCMTEQGYPALDNSDAAILSVSERKRELIEAATVDGVVEDQAGVDEQTQEYERAVAMADLACQREEGYEQLYREVAFELEEQFIDDHRQELERYRDWLAENDL